MGATGSSSVARGSRTHTPESRAKISAANKGRKPWNLGKRHTPETIQRIAEGSRRAAQRKYARLDAERALERERLRIEDPEAYVERVKQEERKHRRLMRRRANHALRREKRVAEGANGTSAASGAPAPRPARAVRKSRAMPNASTGRRGVNFTFTAESRAKISAALRERWKDPEYRERRRNMGVSAETRARLSAAMKAKWRDGTYRDRVTVNGSHSAERCAKISAAIRAKWATDPDYRNKTLSGIRRRRGLAPARPQSRRARAARARAGGGRVS